MALELPAVAYGMPQANMTAARRHVQTLSARDREALLRALLEQYEHPQASSQDPQGPSQHSSQRPAQGPLATSLPSRSCSSTSAASISPFSTSLFDCPPLHEEAEEESALSPPPPLRLFSTTSTASTTLTTSTTPTTSTSFAPTGAAATSSSSSSSSSPGRWTGPSSVPTPRLRSHSLSMSNPQPLRSSSSASHLQQASSHSRSRSMESTMDKDVPQPLRRPADKKALPKPTLTLDTEAATAATAATAAASATSTALPQQQQKPFTYWCTACGETLQGRTAWVQHDVACRGTERRLAREERISGSHSHANNSSRHSGSGGRTQRAWACGFCAAFLGSLERYQSHVAGHFERGRTLAHWHFANVIYGLLHQPAVHKPWKRLWATRVAALPAHLRPKATWSPGCCLLGREGADVQTSLQEALEFFDANVDSASTLAQQADALAIYISVPINEDGQWQQLKPAPTETKTQPMTKAKTQPKEQTTPAATAVPAAASNRPESPPSPATSTTNLLPASTPRPSPPTPTHATQAKNAPLPALPICSTAPASSTAPPPALALESTKKDGKRGSKVSPRKSLFFFKSKSPPSSPESAADKTTETTATNGDTPPRQVIRKSRSSGTRLSKPQPVAPSSRASASTPSFSQSASTTTITSATRATARHTTPARRNNWADRPLPPLIMDDSGVVPSYTSTTAPPIYSRMATGYLSDQPPSPPPKPGAHRPTASSDSPGDWNSIATTIVEDIMAPVNALHITV